MPNIFVYHHVKEKGAHILSALHHYYKKIGKPNNVLLADDCETATDKLLKNAEKFDMFFIDGSDPEIAVKLVKLFRFKNLEASWIWMDASREKMLEFLILRPSGYIEDISDIKRVFQTISAIDSFHSLLRKKQGFVFKFEGDYVNIPYKNICYFESNAKKVTLHLRDGSHRYCFTAKLEDIQKMLPGQFLRCHQSYLVNLDEVRKLDGKGHTFVLNNNDYVLISRRNYSASKEYYEEYLKIKKEAEMPISTKKRPKLPNV